MKTPEQIAAETPDSITTTDYPIFRINHRLHLLLEGGHLADDFFIIPSGTLVRIIGSILNESLGQTVVRYKDEDYFIDNKYLDYVSGDISKKE